MRSCPDSAQPGFGVDENACHRKGLALLSVFILVFWLAPAAPAQSSSSATPPTPQSSAQAPPESQPPAPGTSQTISGDQTPSLADAARKAKASQDKPKAKKVYTDDNLSSVGGTISVVGDKSSGRSNGNSYTDDPAPSGSGKSEAYWRQRASAIKNAIASTDQKIADVKAEIAKQGAASFDPSAGLAQGVIVIHDRNAEVKQLEDQKQSLERQLDDLADEIRKAGGDSGWAR
jgi:hypothetical protein